ncbi:MAG: hypothetical protein R2851_06655 [Caldilineaceae bacterium]
MAASTLRRPTPVDRTGWDGTYSHFLALLGLRQNQAADSFTRKAQAEPQMDTDDKHRLILFN